MKMDLKYIAATKVETPISIEIIRVKSEKILEFQTNDKKERNSWCRTGGKVCAKYGSRPCCPPKARLFSELPKRDYFYSVCVCMSLQDYWDVHPTIDKSKSRLYFAVSGTHTITRNVNNKIVSNFKGQLFRVGGCLGCTYKKQNVCKRYAPCLEATGIDVVKMAYELFNNRITWANYKDKEIMPIMYAIGGVYTNDNIKRQQFQKVIQEVCNN